MPVREYKTVHPTQNLSILLLSSAYNGITQAVERTLLREGHHVSFQEAFSQDAMRAAVEKHQPNLIICPTLMKAIPKDIYETIKCLIVHPGIQGDRGPSSLDWAILKEETEWGVTIIEADEEMDAGAVWASAHFKLTHLDTKTQLYHAKVASQVTHLVRECVHKFQDAAFIPEKLDNANPAIKGKLHETIRQSHPLRHIDWEKDTAEVILKKMRSADSQPGVRATLQVNGLALSLFLYGGSLETQLAMPVHAKPGDIIGRRNEAILIKAKNGAIWVSQLRSPKSAENPHPFKLPAVVHLGEHADHLLDHSSPWINASIPDTAQEIGFHTVHGTYGSYGILQFNFYNGAMNTQQCKRLLRAIQWCTAQNIQALILAGSKSNWSNGIHLNVIEHSKNPAHEAWENLQAINQIIKQIIKQTDMVTVSAVQANAGAGGVYLALASDFVFAKPSIVLNPHYKKMGLYGSELHTYTGMKRVGVARFQRIKNNPAPMLVQDAIEMGLVDNLVTQSTSHIAHTDEHFFQNVERFTMDFLNDPKRLNDFIANKIKKRAQEEAQKSLAEYEKEELMHMYQDIFENRNGFHELREAFVKKLPLDYVVASFPL